MSTILEKIADIEAEMARTQKNKATAGHLGMLKAKLAKLRRELITPKSQGGASEQGFEVAKVRSVFEKTPHNIIESFTIFIFFVDWRCSDRFHWFSIGGEIYSTVKFGRSVLRSGCV